jgi:hypothetical protein
MSELTNKLTNKLTSKLTQEEVRRLLDYNPETGELRWKVRRGGKAVAGSLAGKKYSFLGQGKNGLGKKFTRHYPDKRVEIFVHRKSYRAHRIIWLWMYGKFPTYQIDHIDGDAWNNSLSNLREVTNQQNAFNKRKKTNSSSDFVGVSYHKLRNKYVARIKFNNKHYHLGYFDCQIEGSKAYLTAKEKYHGKEYIRP